MKSHRTDQFPSLHRRHVKFFPLRRKIHMLSCYRHRQKLRVMPTSLNGFILVCMMKGYLHNSQFLMSELCTHRCRQLWWTYFREPEQQQGAASGASGSDSQWQILMFQYLGYAIQSKHSAVIATTCKYLEMRRILFLIEYWMTVMVSWDFLPDKFMSMFSFISKLLDKAILHE